MAALKPVIDAIVADVKKELADMAAKQVTLKDGKPSKEARPLAQDQKDKVAEAVVNHNMPKLVAAANADVKAAL